MSEYLNKKCRDLGYNNYQEYLNSIPWKVFSKTIKDNRKKCFSCKGRLGLVVHHINYNNLGNEFEEDVVVLCKSCHYIVHQLISEENVELRKAHLKVCQYYSFKTRQKKKKYVSPGYTEHRKKSYIRRQISKMNYDKKHRRR